MKKVYICSPCRGDYENNIQRAKEFSRAAVERGCIPITPHIYLTQFMDDTIPAERELALGMGRELVLKLRRLLGRLNSYAESNLHEWLHQQYKPGIWSRTVDDGAQPCEGGAPDE